MRLKIKYNFKLTAALTWLLWHSWFAAHAQSPAVLTYEAFLKQVIENHPVAKIANLTPEQSSQLLRAARGAFDPVAYSTFRQKQFESKEYYSTLEAGMKVPTWFGVTGFAGVVSNDGDYLNPELVTPNGGLAQLGLELNAGQGLLIDKRRAELNKAKLYLQSSEQERKLMLLNLLSEATSGYWQWVSATYQLVVYQRAVALAEERFQGVKTSFIAGDRPAIDTLESYTQVQSRQFSKNEAEVKQIKARQELSTWMWNSNGEPLEITEALQPVQLDSIRVSDLYLLPSQTDSLLNSHPALVQYKLKTDILETERRMYADQLKPKLSFKASLLTPMQSTVYTPAWSFSGSNYSIGFDFSMPLFLRGERGRLASTRIEIQQTNLMLQRKRLELSAKINAVRSEAAIALRQMELFNSYVDNFEALLEAENIRFSNGESSLFLVNARELSVLDARVKLASLIAHYPELIARLYELTGTWPTDNWAPPFPSGTTGK